MSYYKDKNGYTWDKVNNTWSQAKYNSEMPQWWSRKEVGDNRVINGLMVAILTTIFRYGVNYLISKK